MKNQFFLLAAGFFALLLTSCAPAQKLSNEGGFRPGQKMHYRLTEYTYTQTSAFENEGMEIPGSTSTQNKITDLTYTVKKVHPDNSVDLELMFTHIYDKESDDQDGETEYDTDNAIPDSLIDLSGGSLAGKALAYNVLINRPFQMKLGPDGKLVSVKGMNAAWDEMEERFMEESPLAATMLKNMKSQFGDEAMTVGQSDYWSYLPDKPVRVGSKWKKPYQYAPLRLSGSTTYTLKSRDNKQARLSYITKLESDKKNPGVLDMGMIKIRYVLEGSGTGTILLDQPNTTLRRMDQKMTMSGPMQVKTSLTDWITVPISITLDSVFERVEK